MATNKILMATNKILLAEDEVVLGTIVKESLESRGFDVIFCTDGDQAKRQYELHKPELLVLDVMMPKKDGFTLVKEIRQQNKRIPIIFLTAKSSNTTIWFSLLIEFVILCRKSFLILAIF